MIRVRFIKERDGRQVDEVRDYDEVSAKNLIDAGVAVRSRAKSADVPEEAVAADVVAETVGEPQPVPPPDAKAQPATKARKSAD